jgi:two-component system sensor histidine kinase KdpD
MHDDRHRRAVRPAPVGCRPGPAVQGEVMADPAITGRVIANLFGNALRYSPAVSPALVTARTVGDRVELRVADHGPGIPEADREWVFLPFHRLGDRATGPASGSGSWWPAA